MSIIHSVGKNLTANTLTTLFTVPTRSLAKATNILVSNHSTSSKHITVYWYDASANVSIEVLYQYNLTAKAYLIIDSGFYFMMDENDELRAISETGSSTTIIASFEIEQRSTVQQFN
jgi:hypothetical protein